MLTLYFIGIIMGYFSIFGTNQISSIFISALLTVILGFITARLIVLMYLDSDGALKELPKPDMKM
jgi:phosphate/sulfate permease